jgi:hypothetical protein
MLFVGDHALFDAPRSPEVVFHIEAFALERPARAVADLALALRDLGRGSLRRGFDWLADQGALQTCAPGAELKRVEHPGLDPLLLITRDEACPVICYADDAARQASGEPVRFVPGELGPG